MLSPFVSDAVSLATAAFHIVRISANYWPTVVLCRAKSVFGKIEMSNFGVGVINYGEAYVQIMLANYNPESRVCARDTIRVR